MTLQPNDALVGTLAELTAPDRGEPELWARALRAARTPSAARGGVVRRWIAGGARGPWAGRAAGLAAALTLVVGAGLIFRMQGGVNARAPVAAAVPTYKDKGAEVAYRKAVPGGTEDVHVLATMATEINAAGRSYGYAYTPLSGASDSKWASQTPPALRVPEQPGSPAAVQPSRLVVRKCALELKTKDVRVAFAKVPGVLSEAQGEYIEETGLSGDGPTLAATVKLRVAAARVGTVLAQLHDLGEVVQEATSGEDVTEQAVDIDARLRNEQKVEAELQNLLETRRGEPLDDVLKVRESLARVRESIERLTAQRDQLSRLVALATINLVLHADAPVPEVKTTGIGEYFTSGMARAWDSGVKGLADSAAWIVRTAVGGLFGWILLIVVLLGARLAWHRYTRALAQEPAPRL